MASHLASGSGFKQVSIHRLAKWLELGQESASALLVWIWLVRRSDRMNVVRATAQWVADGCRVSERSVFRSFRILEAGNWIERDAAGQIHLNADLVWGTDGRMVGAAKVTGGVAVKEPKPGRQRVANKRSRKIAAVV